MRKRDFKYFSGKKYDGMMSRCYREKDISYPNYGKRGIRVCAEWILDIESFRKWLSGYLNSIGVDVDYFVKNIKKFQLDRIDGNGHYTSENCRLVNPQTNSRNKLKKLRKIVSSEGVEIEI